MDALAWFNLHLGLLAAQSLNLLGKDAGGVDDVAGAYGKLLLAKLVAHLRAAYFVPFAEQRDYFSVVGNRCAILGSGAYEGHSQASVIGLGIVVDKAFFQSR